MKFVSTILVLLLIALGSVAQDTIHILKNNLDHARSDSARYQACWQLYNYYEEANKDSALYYADQEYLLSHRNKMLLSEAIALNHKAYQLIGLGRYAESLKTLIASFGIAENPNTSEKNPWMFTPGSFKGDKRLYILAYAHHIFAILMGQTQNTGQEIAHFREARSIAQQVHHGIREMMADMNLGRCYLTINKYDSAVFFEKESERLAFETGFKKYLGQVYGVLAQVANAKGDLALTKKYYYDGLRVAGEENNLVSLNSNYFLLSKFYQRQGEKDSALYCAKKSLEIFSQMGPVTGANINLGTLYQNIYQCYKLKGQSDSMYKYQGLALTKIDSLSRIRIQSLGAFQNATLEEEMRMQNMEKEKVVYRNRVRIFSLVAGLVIFLIIALILFRNNRQKHKSNKLLQKTLADLKSAQAQLVQSEKMASLGELTAGIAHEIQNPLNFVNNFSDLNSELIGELLEESEKGNLREVKEIASGIRENEQKISYHGKRAAGIVKGMLQHSRAGSDKKELTDINELADEYLRLSYHGLRAKDKSFNAGFKTNFDERVGNAMVMPQELGRVLLNLFNNAFYSVSQKKKQTDQAYEPTIEVSTKKCDDKIIIEVRDNGMGIPKNILEKVYQPFFTTKPTGEGTGLGLSLSYDIITKGHGGELKVETKEGVFAMFQIILPLTNK
jgi:two-component system NtrC family sensor kinase